MLLAQVIVPLSLSGDFTYIVPDHLANTLQNGMRVEVQFGAKRVYAGIVKHLYNGEIPANLTLKTISNILDDRPIVPPNALRLWQWVADYYICTEGEVMQAALPTAFKLSSQTKLILNPDHANDFDLLDDQEFLIAEALSMRQELTLEEAQTILETKNVMLTVKSLLEKGVLFIQEELVERYKPQLQTYLSLSPLYEQTDQLQDLLEQLQKNKNTEKQLMLLMAFLHLSKTTQKDSILKKDLLEKVDVSDSVLKTLLKKGVFIETQKAVSRLNSPSAQHAEEPITYVLADFQRTALTDLQQQLQTKTVVLLHGITASGKTQLYIELIQQTLAAGKQALYLLPEIALTAQMVARLRKVFGNDIGVYHSRFNDQERVEIWHKVLQQEYKVVLGARSAVFLPFQNLGIVVVDEEHDPSFKQHDPAPYYHARDTAIYLANLHKAKVILGSATPSLESYYNASTDKYGLVSMMTRFGGVDLPKIELIDLRQATQNKAMQSHFSRYLIETLQQTVAQGHQAIIFQNRRGYSPYLLCADCEWIPQCVQCDVSLTYHKNSNELRCHYCGYKRPYITHCDSCKSTRLQIQGFGTEKIEDELQAFFVDKAVQIGRLDLDTARTKHGFEQIITNFEDNKLQILVGTQMVTKGLDFDNVNLSVVLSADQLLAYPDFRASERAFQLMTQVSGRAGRRDQQGKVLIQTHNTAHRILDNVLQNDYATFYQTELYERQQYHYPPFTRLIVITLKHKDSNIVQQAAVQLVRHLQHHIKTGVLGPTVPLIARIRNLFLRQVILKIARNTASLHQSKQILRQSMQQIATQKDFKSVQLVIDVDPY